MDRSSGHVQSTTCNDDLDDFFWVVGNAMGNISNEGMNGRLDENNEVSNSALFSPPLEFFLHLPLVVLVLEKENVLAIDSKAGCCRE